MTAWDRRRLAKLYATTALVVFNTAVLFLLCNLALWTVFPVLRRFVRTRAVVVDTAFFRQVLPGMSVDEIVQLKAEHNHPFRFDPFTMFREAARHGQFVNVDTAGFRHGANNDWPPNPAMVNVFTFGGSTMFGWGVPDTATIAAALQRSLTDDACGDRVRVYNFGQPGFFSTQERALFELLLLDGFRPRVAVFLDGLNDADVSARGWPQYADQFNALFQAVQDRRPPLIPVLQRIPLFRAEDEIRRRWFATDAGQLPPDSAVALKVLDRWTANRNMITTVAAANGVVPMFVWQPVREWSYHPMPEDQNTQVYRLMNPRRLAGGDTGVVWLADMQKNRPDSLYVDDEHYTGAFNAVIADSIASNLRRRGTICEVPGGVRQNTRR